MGLWKGLSEKMLFVHRYERRGKKEPSEYLGAEPSWHGAEVEAYSQSSVETGVAGGK